MPGGEVAAVAAEVTSAVAKAAAQTTPAVASAAEGAASAGATTAVETATEGAVSAAQGVSTTVAEQTTNAGLAASAEQVTQAQGVDAGLQTVASKDSWGTPEPIGTTGAKPDSNEPSIPPTEPDMTSDSTVTPGPTAEVEQQLDETELDSGGLKPGDRSYDAIIAEGDAKRAYEAAKADPATSPEDLARREKEYTDATGEREQAVADRDSATIDARTEEIKREVTDSVKQEFQGQIDKLSLSNAELRQAIQDMGRQVIEAIGKNNTEAFSEFKKYVDEQDPKKKEALWVKILIILATVGKEFLVGSGVSETIQQGTTSQRR